MQDSGAHELGPQHPRVGREEQGCSGDNPCKGIHHPRALNEALPPPRVTGSRRASNCLPAPHGYLLCAVQVELMVCGFRARAANTSLTNPPGVVLGVRRLRDSTVAHTPSYRASRPPSQTGLKRPENWYINPFCLPTHCGMLPCRGRSITAKRSTLHRARKIFLCTVTPT